MHSGGAAAVAWCWVLGQKAPSVVQHSVRSTSFVQKVSVPHKLSSSLSGMVVVKFPGLQASDVLEDNGVSATC